MGKRQNELASLIINAALTVAAIYAASFLVIPMIGATLRRIGNFLFNAMFGGNVSP